MSVVIEEINRANEEEKKKLSVEAIKVVFFVA